MSRSYLSKPWGLAAGPGCILLLCGGWIALQNSRARTREPRPAGRQNASRRRGNQPCEFDFARLPPSCRGGTAERREDSCRTPTAST